MILHQNHHFILNHHASIQLPNGMYLNCETDKITDDSLELIAPDKSFRLQISVLMSEKDAETFAKEIYEELEGATVVEPVHATETPTRLHGYATTFATKTEVYEEYVLDLKAHSIVDFWLLRAKDEPYDKKLYETVKEELLAGIDLC